MTKQSAVKKLHKLRALLDKNWTKGTMVRDEDGIADYIARNYNPKTCKFCLVGGARFVTNGDPLDDLEYTSPLLKALFGALPKAYVNKQLGKSSVDDDPSLMEVTLVNYNDEKKRTKRAILHLIDRAIVRLS